MALRVNFKPKGTLEVRNHLLEDPSDDAANQNFVHGAELKGGPIVKFYRALPKLSQDEGVFAYAIESPTSWSDGFERESPPEARTLRTRYQVCLYYSDVTLA